MKRLLFLLLSLGILSPLAACARSQPLVDVQVVDLDEGNTLPRYPFQGRDYLAGQPGHRFSVSLQNLTGERVLAVLSVDGVNAISGQTAGSSQAGYVLEPWHRAVPRAPARADRLSGLAADQRARIALWRPVGRRG